MYKAASRFNNSLVRRGGNKFNRFSTRMSGSFDAVDRHTWHEWHAEEARALDASAARVTPSLRKKPTIKPIVVTKLKSPVNVGTSVYLVRFTLKTDRSVSFVKVGVSSVGISARFCRDRSNYDISTICKYDHLSRRDALAIEGAIHRAFYDKRIRPPVRLASGNTECFRDTESFVIDVSNIITGR